MKRYSLLILIVLVFNTLKAQRICIFQGQTIWVCDAKDANQLPITENKYVNIAGKQFILNEIDSIKFDKQKVDPLLVNIQYKDTHPTENKATITLPIALHSTLIPHIDGAHVDITMNESVATEYTYQLSGKSNNGSFTLHGNYKCTLSLNQLQLQSNKGAAIDIDNSKRIAIIANGENKFVDSNNGTQKACFFVKGHPELKGEGLINILGRSNHAFASNEYTEIKSTFGGLNILGAKKDGIHVKQYFYMKGGKVTITNTSSDGIDVECTKHVDDEYNGEINIRGGNIDIQISTDDAKAIKCKRKMRIAGGNINIFIKGEGVHGINTDSDLIIEKDELATETPTVDITAEGDVFHKGELDESKTRGIRVKGNFMLKAGNVKVKVSGKKAKTVKVDGKFTNEGGTINCPVFASA